MAEFTAPKMSPTLGNLMRPLNAKVARAWPISGTAHRRTPALELATARPALAKKTWFLWAVPVADDRLQSRAIMRH
jgi:hypothetical protein